MDRGSMSRRLTTAKQGKKQQAGNFQRLEPSTLVKGPGTLSLGYPVVIYSGNNFFTFQRVPKDLLFKK